MKDDRHHASNATSDFK
jgi:hypothetical protein